MDGRIRPPESLKATEQPAEKKKGFADWMSLTKPDIEEKEHWVKIRVLRILFFFAFLSPANCRSNKSIFKKFIMGLSIYLLFSG